ncbi:hypothetical protein [Myxococcus sp. RHSTA-1-4]|uniref:hypothetical protein n=1 Tax=Myxococcus sp. RHSTA-1-4 TaxID=2874601 RepID=UPI001CBE93DC|nr:hypothetical protein [Myxococcus sp. RHSTA-1-4]MBZ4421679.1 hypothetical protein [Myxococcus sp. RHSTA-1-4]
MRAPRWRHLLAALLVLGGASGCPGNSVPCLGGSQQPPASSQRVSGVDQEVVLTIPATLTRACDSDEPPRQPESVSVEVSDPENRPVPATVSLGTGSALVRFRPTKPGRHHVIVAFAPVGSLHQLDVLVVEDHRDAPPLASFPGGTSCPYVDRTARGTWLCGARAVRAPGGAFQPLADSPDAAMAVAGDVVWTLAGDRVLRYIDTGTGPLELTSTAPFPLAPGTPGGPIDTGTASRLATPEELLLVRKATLYRYTFTEPGGLVRAPETSLQFLNLYASLGRDPAGALLLRAGARLLVVGNANDPRTSELRLQACPYQLGEDGAYLPVLDAPCQGPEGEPVGYEEGVLWTVSTTFSSGFMLETLHRYPAASGRLVEEGGLALDGALVTERLTLRPGPILPSLTAPGAARPFAMPRWNPATGLVDLELTPDPGGFIPAPRIGERFIWVENVTATGGVTVYARPSTR